MREESAIYTKLKYPVARRKDVLNLTIGVVELLKKAEMFRNVREEKKVLTEKLKKEIEQIKQELKMLKNLEFPINDPEIVEKYQIKFEGIGEEKKEILSVKPKQKLSEAKMLIKSKIENLDDEIENLRHKIEQL